jgi:hypothetical protein
MDCSLRSFLSPYSLPQRFGVILIASCQNAHCLCANKRPHFKAIREDYRATDSQGVLIVFKEAAINYIADLGIFGARHKMHAPGWV